MRASRTRPKASAVATTPAEMLDPAVLNPKARVAVPAPKNTSKAVPTASAISGRFFMRFHPSPADIGPSAYPGKFSTFCRMCKARAKPRRPQLRHNVPASCGISAKVVCADTRPGAGASWTRQSRHAGPRPASTGGRTGAGPRTGDGGSDIEQQRRRSHWAWGYEDETPAGAQLRSTAAAIAAALGFGDPAELEEPVPLHQVRLPSPRLSPPGELAGICSQSVHDRAWHAHGQSYRDLISAFRGRLDHVPDLVARPHREDEVTALLSWCEDVGAAVIPFGGGTSVN